MPELEGVREATLDFEVIVDGEVLGVGSFPVLFLQVTAEASDDDRAFWAEVLRDVRAAVDKRKGLTGR